ncbi:TPA: hypothetical protein ACKFQ2_002545 [Citrobacter amalonaticus]|uniref:hypothetical protein n=2 Tax=Enterobacteriaceae TaxID=543 RepID=UPI003894A8C4|nr:hypothetical protein [Citrobacter amalonaticus]
MNSKKNNEKSTATSTKEEECIKEFIISDKFKKMMTNVLNSTKNVLTKRLENLNNWTEADQQEFLTIFGVPGDFKITSQYSSKGEKDFLSETLDARTYMKESISRLIFICEKISVQDRVCENGLNVYGNFVNNTSITPGSARVNDDRTIGLEPELYKNELKVEILQNFTKKKYSGSDSKVSTLCHELSHFCRYLINGEQRGGMGTKDSPTKTFDSNYNYVAYAKSLVDKHSPEVFNNAYNIEKYFEIKPDV